MEISSILIGLILFCLALYFVSTPFRQRLAKTDNLFKARTLEKGGHEVVLAALRDLDFDFKTGKVSEGDYQPLRAQLMAEAAQYIETEQKEDDQLEALIRSRRKAQKQDAKCEHCGAPMAADQRFCSKCGSAASYEQCPSCGKRIRTSDLFCPSCGTKLQIQAKAVA